MSVGHPVRRSPASGVRAAQARVSATTTNLGGGFDCVGMAVDRWLEARVTASADDAEGGAPPAIGMSRGGTLAGLGAREPRDDLLYVGFAAACAARGRPLPARLDFAAMSEIPVGRGLGSSAAAVVAGAALANRVLALGLDAEALATVCAEVEHHPDNVAAAVFGGAVLVVRPAAGAAGTGGSWLFARLTPHPSLAFAFAVPDFEISTAASRRAMPETLPHPTAVAAAGKGAALVHGLSTGRADLLAAALDDVLHVPYRRAMVQGYDAVTAAARSAGAIGATLSGSGPTLVAVAVGNAAARAAAEAMRAAWATIGVQAETIVAGGGTVVGGVEAVRSSPAPPA